MYESIAVVVIRLGHGSVCRKMGGGMQKIGSDYSENLEIASCYRWLCSFVDKIKRQDGLAAMTRNYGAS